MSNLLPDNYWDNLNNPVAQSGSNPPAPVSNPTGIKPIDEMNSKIQNTPDKKIDFNAPTKISITGDLSPEEQVKKYGGVVGSPEYYNTISKEGTTRVRAPEELPTAEDVKNSMSVPHQTGLEVAKALGYNLPMGEEWDKMSTTDKIASVTAETGAVAVKTVAAIPKTMAKIVASIGLTAFKPFYNMFTGKPFDASSMEKTKPTNIPGLGDVPTLYETVEQARQSGMGPAMSYLFAGSDFVLKTAAMLPITEALVNTFKPRPASGALGIEGKTLNTEPIKYAQGADGAYRAPTNSVSEYYTMPKTESIKFGGNTTNIKWKLLPSGEGEQALSVVKNVKAKIGSYVKTEYGLKQVQQGDFGPEIILYSQPVKTGLGATPVSVVATEGKKPIFILPETRKGLETRPITQDQLDNLNRIGQTKNMDPQMRDAVVKTLTGKENIGALNEAEYVRVSNTLAKFGEKYGVEDKSLGPVNFIKGWLSPQRHYFSYLEDTYGYPLNSQLYQPLERAQQLVKVLDSSIQPELDGIFGEFASPSMVDERRLIDAYVRGDKAAITGNKSISPEIKTAMIDVANKLTAWDNQYGEVLGVGKDAYLANYGGPKITNLGGVFPQYKNLDITPTKEFFAKFKREGSLDPYIDDPYASRQIYIKEGAKALHYKPVLANFEAMKEQLPPEIFKAANSYVQEKMGKLGGMEKFLDSFVPQINKKFGINLPADATRQGISYALSSMYSGLVGTPQAMFKQIFQLPLFVYSRLGTRFAGEAFIKSLKQAERDRVAKLGYLNEISMPYGAELAKDFNPLNKAGALFKGYTQASVKPMTYVDNDVRIKTFLQAEMQWNDSLNLYKGGKIQWNNLENNLDFSAFSPSTRNLIRQKLVAGDEAGAFDVYVRDIIDETSFPYRTGSGARVGYGMAGKLSTGLLNYTIESTNVLAKWLTTKQWDKVIRFAGNAKIMNDAMKDEFGMDFSSTLYQKFGGVVSPVVGFVGNVYGYFKALIDNNRTDMNTNAGDIAKTLKSDLPTGLVAQNVSNFNKSIKDGVDSNGQYAIYDNYGKLVRNGDFTDLFWGTLMGFPTVSKMNERNTYNNIKNAQVEEQDIKNQVNQLLREGKYDEMEKLIQKTGVFPSASTMETSYIPRLERAFQTLSPQLKSQFIQQVYPQ